MSYGWGSDSGSSRPSTPRGYDFESARKAYKEPSKPKSSVGTTSGRMSDYKSRIGKTPPPIGKELVSESTHPIVIATDVTGSMSHWPGIIFEKLPLLGEEVKRYAPNYEISFVAFGDAYCDAYPVQVRDFASGKPLDDHVAGLFPERGGGDDPESHDIIAYYYLHHCKIEKAVKPIFIFITDVRSHDRLDDFAVKKWIGDDVQEDLNSVELLKSLSDKFSVYVFLKDMHNRKFWEDIYGVQKVKPIEEPRDVVELLIGVIANEVGELKDFEMRSSRRHEDMPDRVERVMKSIKKGSESTDPESEGKAKSIGGSIGSKKSKDLI